MNAEKFISQDCLGSGAEIPEEMVENAVLEKDGIISGLWERAKSGIDKSMLAVEQAIGRPLDKKLVVDIGRALEQQLYQQGSGEGSKAFDRLKAAAAATLPLEKAALLGETIDRAGKLVVDLRELSAAAQKTLAGLRRADSNS